ncbi:TetR/AcrR family transcriptional regulator [uncultured Aquimarina sp.]|uniref:TetR/AcrR family transcriptional regulator n=1 Tax=uncultured Aquimarina sp. TaxID=575652 RepID=UPI0026117D00|nr:TetR/AcrR family transcriptional regulator [uncultured Aquimarina sp.]
MTEKQEKIINSALTLFAKEGYTATSTSKVAKHAGVSEGLIFRHFKNKEGLLQAILQQGEARIKELFIPILTSEDPKEVIRLTLEMPFSVTESEFEFWKLQFKLKWELEYNNPEKMQPLQQALMIAFQKLGYEIPELEAEFIIIFLEGISTAIIKDNMSDKLKFKDFLIQKYKL